MRKVNYLMIAFAALIISSVSVKAQVDPAEPVIEIPGGAENIGQLELIINTDVAADGITRLNPSRVYKLMKDQVYIQQAAIVFADTLATLIIEGEEGGNMPIVLMQPLEGVEKFANECSGNLTISNVYWPAMNLNELGTTLFNFKGKTARLKLENFVTENARADIFGMRDVTGYANVYIKNSYFRDLSQLSNSWNYVVFARGNNGEAFDTLWIENTTVSNGGMPLFGKGTVTEFMYLNHNTFYNSTKYPIWLERFAEAYVTNNLFLNANWEGECEATWSTQIGEDFIPSGQIRFDTIESDFWAGAPGGVESAPAQEDVKILASNNLNWFSPLLDKYYNGEYNDKFDKPISFRPWGTVGDDGVPTAVLNTPVPMFADRELALIADWDGIKADNNWDIDTDPGVVTQSPADEAAAEEWAHFARANYQAADEGETWDRTKIWFGDGLASTVPGGGTETGGGFADVTGLPEDFSYTNTAVVSAIDGLPLGALSWYPDHLATWDSEAALEDVKQYYADGIGVGIFETKTSSNNNEISLYPNPVKNLLNVSSKNELSYASFYSVTGKLVMEVELNGVFSKDMDVSGLESGLYILQVRDVEGEANSMKFLKQ